MLTIPCGGSWLSCIILDAGNRNLEMSCTQRSWPYFFLSTLSQVNRALQRRRWPARTHWKGEVLGADWISLNHSSSVCIIWWTSTDRLVCSYSEIVGVWMLYRLWTHKNSINVDIIMTIVHECQYLVGNIATGKGNKNILCIFPTEWNFLLIQLYPTAPRDASATCEGRSGEGFQQTRSSDAWLVLSQNTQDEHTLKFKLNSRNNY